VANSVYQHNYDLCQLVDDIEPWPLASITGQIAIQTEAQKSDEVKKYYTRQGRIFAQKS
jgi:hypothetical protein